MKLKSIQKLDDTTITGVLSAIALDMLPNPGVSAINTQPVDQYLKAQVFEELKQKVGVELYDDSESAKQKLIKAITAELVRIALSKADIKSVKMRLGKNGDLRPDLYNIKFAKTFDDYNAKLGIRRSHVEAAFRSPDSVEHLFAERSDVDGKNQISLFLKNHETVGKPPFILLILTHRDGDTLTVMDAWRVFPSEIDYLASDGPLIVLKKFVEQYGLEVKVGNKTSKFFLYETIELAPGQSHVDAMTVIGNGVPHLDNFMATILNNTAVVAFAFSLDFQKYVDHLLKYGVVTKSENLLNKPVAVFVGKGGIGS